jgi:PAS domain S-box-containing protein
MVAIAVLVGWVVVIKGIAQRMSTLSAFMLRGGDDRAKAAVAVAGDDEIGQMGEAVRAFLSRGQELILTKAALDQARNSVLLFAPDTLSIFYVNNGAVNLSGYGREELLGMHPADLNLLHDDTTIRRLIEPLRNGEVTSTTFESDHRHREGHLFPVEVTLQYIRPDDFSPFVIAVVRDISEHKKQESAIEAALAEAEKANQAKSRFLSGMSHELRTPLNAIMGFGQLLKTDPDHPLASEQSTAVRHILDSAEYLKELIGQILDLAKIESDTLAVSLEPVRPDTVMTECVNMLAATAEKKGISIRMKPSGGDGAPLVDADRTRLRQVLLNLLSNATKYNRPGGSVTVSCIPQQAGTLRFSVSDTGYGIPEKYHQKVFTPFDRLAAEGSTTEGTGIGLSISRQLVELMGGRIGFFSEEGTGSTFWFDLPLAKEEETSRHEPETNTFGATAEAVDLPPCTVLYVEDNPVNMGLMELVFARTDEANLIGASTAESGIEATRSSLPDIVLMDINLPGMDGFSALEALRDDPLTRDIPIIAVSANATPDDIAAATAAGFDGYVAKPFHVAGLLATMSKALQ